MTRKTPELKIKTMCAALIAAAFAAGTSTAAGLTFTNANHEELRKAVDQAVNDGTLTAADNVTMEYTGTNTYYGAAVTSQSDFSLEVNDFTAVSSQKGIATKEPTQNISITAHGSVLVQAKASGALHTAADSGKGAGSISIKADGDVRLESGGWAIHNNGGGVIDIQAGGKFEVVAGSGISNNVSQSEINDGHLNITAQSISIAPTSKYGVISLGSGGISLDAKEDIYIKAGSDSTSAIQNSAGEINIKAGGSTVVEGDVFARGAADINVNFKGESSSLTGVVATTGTGSTNFGFTDKAVWTVTGASNVTNLTLEGGVIDISETEDNVEVGTVTGTGSVLMDATAANTVTATTADSATLTARSVQNADEVTTEQAQALVERLGGVANKQAVVDEGMYNGAIVVDGDGTTSVTTNTLMRDVLDLAGSTTLSLNRILMNDVRKRLGDIRSGEGTVGAWARWDGGRLSGEGVDNSFNTLQIGADTALLSGAVRLGASASYTSGDADYVRGQADMDAYSLALYATWLSENGMFADVIARYANADTDMTVDGNKTGTLSNNAWSISGEFGQRFDLGSLAFVEPQIEATYTYIDSDTLGLSEGSSYEFDALDSFIGRIGVASGLKFPDNKGNVYMKVSAVHEFLGDAAVTGANGTKFEANGSDTWIEYGIGANFNVSPTAYFWADLQRTSGAVLDEEWRATVGLRYGF